MHSKICDKQAERRKDSDGTLLFLDSRQSLYDIKRPANQVLSFE
ncbi:hypothetical protein [Methanosarcina sp. UBA289]|nr:hypothetical protein [Methanosarcina sp. UBA289]